MKKSQERWGDAHVRLRKLFDQRAGMSQLEFAERFGLGTQGMVWQYLSGYRPLNYEAAAKFAKGLNCRIDDFSPEMAEALREEILPVLGRTAKAAAKVAVILALVLPPLLADRVQSAIPEQFSRVCIKLTSAATWVIYHVRQLFRTTGQSLKLACA